MASEKDSELIQAIDSEPLKEILLLLTKDLLSKTETIKKQNAQIRELRKEVIQRTNIGARKIFFKRHYYHQQLTFITRC